jgi:hypothetical protein
MASDEHNGVVVLYGGTGLGSQSLTDTWTWDGRGWTQQHPQTNPSAPQESLMTFDPAVNAVVLLKDEGGGSGRIVETWTWDGQDWAQLHPANSPPGGSTFYGSLASQHSTGSLVLVPAGTTGSPNPTWIFQNGTWTQRTPPGGPPGRYWFSMAGDDATGNVVVFAGESGHGTLNDTWTWDGTTWSQLHPAVAPTARNNGIAANLVYDAALGRTVLVGGVGPSGILSDVWEWDGRTWALAK